MKNKENIDNMLIEVIGLLEKGKSASEILDRFPKYKKELQEICTVIGVLKKGGAEIKPPEFLLEQTLARMEPSLQWKGELLTSAKINLPVTKSEIFRYPLYMWKFFLPIGAIAVVVALLFVTQFEGIIPGRGPERAKTVSQETFKATKEKVSKAKKVNVPSTKTLPKVERPKPKNVGNPG